MKDRSWCSQRSQGRQYGRYVSVGGTILFFLGILQWQRVMFLRPTTSSDSIINKDNREEPSITTESESLEEDRFVAIINKDDREEPSNTTESPEKDPLQVAWVMSFPNSGTSYTMKLIQRYSKTTAATNYVSEIVDETKPVYIDVQQKGPFVLHPPRNRPPKYIATKTHCAQERGSTSIFQIDSASMFEKACADRHELRNGRQIHTYYSSMVHRAIHIIRDPFDNVVSRFHHFLKHGKQKYTHGFNKTKEGFRAYCRRSNKPFHRLKWNATLIFGDDPHKEEKLLHFFPKVPCYTAFLQYTQWHNFAVAMLQQRGLSRLDLFYEDYSTRFKETVEELFDFLALKPAREGAHLPRFVVGKKYIDYYEPHEIKAAKKLIREIASPETMELLERYLH